MKVTIEGFGEMTKGCFEIRQQTEFIPPGLRRLPDGSVWYDEDGHCVVTGPDIVTITGEWRGHDLPIGEPLFVTCERNTFHCVVTDQYGARVRLRGERVAGEP